MKKKILTLNDLYNFYSTNKRYSHFNSKKDGYEIAVQIDGSIKFDSDNDKHKEGLYPVHLQACHTEKNVNQSFISDETMSENMESFKNRPILAYIHEVDGQPEFYDHRMHMEDEELVYDEVPIGIIPESCNAYLEYDEEKGHNYVNVDGYVFGEYAPKAIEILEREGECYVSVELSVRDISYNAKENYLQINDFSFSGVTILGKNPEGKDVQPGMQGSNIKLTDFSAKNNSMFSSTDINEKLVDTLEKLNTTLSSFNINDENHQNQKEGGNDVNKFEELLEKYSKTKEDITFEVEGLSDEELEAKFAEAFEETTDGQTSEGGDDPSQESEAQTKEFSKTFEVRFELSHSDVRYALYNLIEQFDELDNDYYFIRDVYDDHFIMQGWVSNDIYGCKYTKDDETVSLSGERYKLYEELLTESEKTSLDEMRSNYSALNEKVASYEAAESRAKKEEILKDQTYAEFLEKDAFKELAQDMDKYSVEEFTEKAELAFAKCVRENKNFSLNKSSKGIVFSIPTSKEKKKSPYGNIFKNKD